MLTSKGSRITLSAGLVIAVTMTLVTLSPSPRLVWDSTAALAQTYQASHWEGCEDPTAGGLVVCVRDHGIESWIGDTMVAWASSPSENAGDGRCVTSDFGNYGGGDEVIPDVCEALDNEGYRDNCMVDGEEVLCSVRWLHAPIEPPHADTVEGPDFWENCDTDNTSRVTTCQFGSEGDEVWFYVGANLVGWSNGHDCHTAQLTDEDNNWIPEACEGDSDEGSDEGEQPEEDDTGGSGGPEGSDTDAEQAEVDANDTDDDGGSEESGEGEQPDEDDEQEEPENPASEYCQPIDDGRFGCTHPDGWGAAVDDPVQWAVQHIPGFEAPLNDDNDSSACTSRFDRSTAQTREMIALAEAEQERREQAEVQLEIERDALEECQVRAAGLQVQTGGSNNCLSDAEADRMDAELDALAADIAAFRADMQGITAASQQRVEALQNEHGLEGGHGDEPSPSGD